MTPEPKPIAYLAEAYFHQDYDVAYGTPDDVIRGFARDEQPIMVSDLLEDLRRALSAPMTEADMRGLWSPRLYPAFDPPLHGMTYRQWFEHIREVLTSAGSLG